MSWPALAICCCWAERLQGTAVAGTAGGYCAGLGAQPLRGCAVAATAAAAVVEPSSAAPHGLHGKALGAAPADVPAGAAFPMGSAPFGGGLAPDLP